MAVLDELAGRLIDGNVASSSGSGTGWYLWRGAMPDSTALPDRAVALRKTGGLPPLLNLDIDQPSVQVIVRGASIATVSSAYKEARTKAQEVRDRLHFAVGVTLSTVEYPGILAVQEPFYMGEDMNQRPVFVCNYRAWRTQP